MAVHLRLRVEFGGAERAQTYRFKGGCNGSPTFHSLWHTIEELIALENRWEDSHQQQLILLDANETRDFRKRERRTLGERIRFRQISNRFLPGR